jgi:sugar lactone lactonase YvrE
MPPVRQVPHTVRVVPFLALLVALDAPVAAVAAAPVWRPAPTAAASEPCGPFTKLYTSDADFNQGALSGVVTNSGQLELSNAATTWPYAWIANAGDGTLSKVNTLTGNEEGRYHTGPPDNANSYAHLYPSRTVVDRNGACWVANRTLGPYVASVTQVVLTGGDDRNNNNSIETSTDLNADGDCADPGELLPWGQDERVKRHYRVGNTLNDGARGMVIDKAGFLWVGITGTQTLHKLDPNLPIATYAPNQPPAVAPSLATIFTGHTPYGLALSPNGMIYQSTAGNYALEIDPGLASGGTAFGPAVTPDSIFHDGANYGIAVDRNCIVWLAIPWHPTAPDGVVRWDPSLTNGNPLAGWTFSGPGAPAGTRGITVDFNNNVWATCNDTSNSVVRYSNTPTPTVTGVFPTPALTACGVGAASDGHIIVTSNGSSVWAKVDNTTGAVLPLPGPQLTGYLPYTYSDFTGALQSVTSFQQGTWNVVTDGLSSARVWDLVSWTPSTPPGTSVIVEARAAQTLPQLSAASWITLGAPGPQAPLPGRYIETQVRLIRAVEGCAASFVTPILYDLTVGGTCDTCAFANCPPDTTLPCQFPEGAIFEYTPPALEPDCGPGYVYTCVPPSGSVLPIGVTPVTCTAVNGPDTVVCRFNVTVLPGCDPSPTGACCLGTTCTVTTHAACVQQGGIYFGDGSNCTVGCRYDCVPPPNAMSVWLKLDPDGSGAGTAETPNLAAPERPGTLVGGPTPLFGEGVGGAYEFDGASQYVELSPLAGAVGAGDFTIDAWVRTSAAAGVVPIVDKRTSPPVRGYGLFLQNGFPALTLAVDGSSSTFALSDLNGGPEAFVADGAWHLVAVSVDRDATDGVRFHVDGHPVGGAFDPTPRMGSLDSPAPLLVGRDNAPVARYFPGPLDEIEIIHEVVSPLRLAGLHAAGAGGKCPETCYATQNAPCCDGISTTSSFTVCNHDVVPHVYSYGVSAVNGGPGCGAVGPVGFAPTSGQITVPAGGCATVPLYINCPSYIPPGQVACYRVSLFNHDTARLFACTGSVRPPNKWCLKWVPLEPVEFTGFLPLAEGLTATVNLEVRNLARTPATSTLDYQVRVFGGHDDDPTTAVSLNGLPPGEPVLGSVPVGAGATAVVPVTVRYPKGWRIGYDRLALLADDDGDGTVEKLAETALRGVPAGTVGVPDRPVPGAAADAGRLFLAVPNPFADGGPIRFRLPERAEVRLRLYDLGGRAVRAFHMETRLEAGDHAVPWDARDGRGEPLKAGLYFLRLEAGERGESIKIVVRR